MAARFYKVRVHELPWPIRRLSGSEGIEFNGERVTKSETGTHPTLLHW